jgi:hypothetical protein
MISLPNFAASLRADTPRRVFKHHTAGALAPGATKPSAPRDKLGNNVLVMFS